MTDTQTYVDTELMFLAEMTEAEPCEHSRHEKDSMKHSGAGEWYVHVHCDLCGMDDVKLMCDTFIRYITGLRSVMVYCAQCPHTSWDYQDFYRSITKKSKGTGGYEL